MDEAYDPAAVERAAQHYWRTHGTFQVREQAGKDKFYCLSMLPYPSGRLHMGHVRNYTIGDVIARYMRMQGRNVLQPMGWDAFGLPAENAAMSNGVPPARWTRQNIEHMRAQLNMLGFGIDWSRELATCDPSYYRWNQWLFLRMLEKGIAYRKTGVVNWDPVDQTVLANEQVIEGRGWRTGALVEKREIPMYYLNITRYADELLGDLERLPGWPERVKLMQANWIGRSVGCEVAFPYAPDTRAALGEGGALKVFTTRADTIYGVTFMAVAAEHPVALAAAAGDPALAAFIEECRRGSVMEADVATQEKKGMRTGLHVLHPFTGQPIEVWVANYVLMGYGEGAVMGVPAHDERDFAIAHKYGLPIRQVIDVAGKAFSADAWEAWYADKEAGVCIRSGRYDGLGHAAAVEAIARDLESQGLGRTQTQYRLRDWGISRQRYWGTPIPIIHCESCGPVPVPDADLPVTLPEDLIPDGSGNPLDRCEEFLRCACPRCGKSARRETDTMDTFVDSSWYFLRYCSPGAGTGMVDERARYWMPMDQYIGGIEHAVLHLLYARFWTKVMRDLGIVDFDEPFRRLFTQGMLLNDCFYREEEGGRKRWFYPSEVELRHDERGRAIGATSRADGQPVTLGGIEKMSKSKNNVVEPRDIIARFGADTARAFVMFAGPPDQSAAWSDAGAEGTHRFLRRLWSFAQGWRKASAGAASGQRGDAAIRFEVHSLLRQVNYDYERLQYNTVVSGAMKLLNLLETPGRDAADAGIAAAVDEGLHILLRVLYPVAPHITQEIWNALELPARFGELVYAPWPEPDPAALQRSEIELVVQVNGKLRGAVRVPADASRETIEAATLADAGLAKYITGTPKKVVVVPGKLVNVVV